MENESQQNCLQKKVEEILGNEDWTTLTIRKVAEKIAGQVTEKSKQQIRLEVRQIVLSILRQQDHNASQGLFTGLRKPLKVDDRLAKVLHCGIVLPRTQVVRRINQYIKEHELQDPEERRKIRLNDELRSLFGVETTTFFGLNKLISPFLSAPTEQEKKLVDEYIKEHWHEAQSAAEESKKKRKRSNEERSNNVSSERGKSLQKPWKLSATLAKVCGAAYLSRSQVIKKIWEYIKERQLQNPQDKRYIRCDVLLRELFGGQEQVNSFSISKYLGAHLERIEEMTSHSDDELEAVGEQWSLYRYVDLNKAVCLNESEPNSIRYVLRPFHLKGDRNLPVLTSAVDEQLLLFIPFTNTVKLKAIAVIGGGGESNPSQVRLFINNEQLVDFSAVQEAKPIQTIDLAPESTCHNWIEYPTKYTKFQNVHSLIMFFPSNFGALRTIIEYIGLKGEGTNYRREAVHAVYEARPLAKGSTTSQENQNMPSVQ
eukprot:jgi/Galph1/1725/GphlegSOOS_G402.1